MNLNNNLKVEFNVYDFSFLKLIDLIFIINLNEVIVLKISEINEIFKLFSIM